MISHLFSRHRPHLQRYLSHLHFHRRLHRPARRRLVLHYHQVPPHHLHLPHLRQVRRVAIHPGDCVLVQKIKQRSN